MKENPLIIHEFELEIGGVSVEWIKQNQEVIIQSIYRAFNRDFPESTVNDLIDHIEIDLGHTHNISDFLLYLELEIYRWQESLITNKNNTNDENRLDNRLNSLDSNTDWDSLFATTKDFFNPEITTNSTKIISTFSKVSKLFYQGKEQFWRWLEGLGLDAELITKFRKFISNQHLPDEAIIAWVTSMILLKDKKPDENYDNILIQLLYQNFTKSNKFSTLLKKQEDEFIALLNSRVKNSESNSQLLSEMMESDYKEIESLLTIWNTFLPDSPNKINLLKQIPIVYLIQLLKNKDWSFNNVYWDQLSTYLINNNIISKEELQLNTSIHSANDIINITHQWILQQINFSNQTKASVSAILLIFTKSISISQREEMLRGVLTEISTINKTEIELLINYWLEIWNTVESRPKDIEHVMRFLKQLVYTLEIIKDSKLISEFNLIQFLESNKSNLSFPYSKEPIPIDIPRENQGAVLTAATIEQNPLKRLLIKYSESIYLVNSSNISTATFLKELQKNIVQKSEFNLSEIQSLIRSIFASTKSSLIFESYLYLQNKISSTTVPENLLFQWIEWLHWISNEASPISIDSSVTANSEIENLQFEQWINNDIPLLSKSTPIKEEEILSNIQSEITKILDNSQSAVASYSEEILEWMQSFLKEIEDEKFSNSIYRTSYYSVYFFLKLKLERERKLHQLRSISENHLLIRNIQNNTLSISDIINKIRISLQERQPLVDKSIVDFLAIIYAQSSFDYEKINKNSFKELDWVNHYLAANKAEGNLSNSSIAELVNSLIQSGLWIYYSWQKNQLANQNNLEINEITSPNTSDKWQCPWDIGSPNIQLLMEEFSEPLRFSILNLTRIINQLDYAITRLDPEFVQPYNSENLTKKLTHVINQLTEQEFNEKTNIGRLFQLNQHFLSLLNGIGFSIEEIIIEVLNNNSTSNNLFISSNSLVNKENTTPQLNLLFKSLSLEEVVPLQIIDLLSAWKDQMEQLLENSENLILENLKKYEDVESISALNNLIENSIFHSPIPSDTNDPIEIWSNHLDTKITIETIFNKSEIFLNLIDEDRLMMETQTSGRGLLQYSSVSRFEFIQTVITHPKWRELYVQLARNKGEGFHRLTSKISLFEVIQLVEHKFPTSKNLIQEINELLQLSLNKISEKDIFIENFKQFWIQQTSPPNSLRSLQLIIDAFFNSYKSTPLLVYINEVILPSKIFKKLSKNERKTLDEWIQKSYHDVNPVDYFPSTYIPSNHKISLFNKIIRRENIVRNTLLKPKDSTNPDYEQNEDDLRINTTETISSPSLYIQLADNQEQPIESLVLKDNEEKIAIDFPEKIQEFDLAKIWADMLILSAQKLIENPSLSQSNFAEIVMINLQEGTLSNQVKIGINPKFNELFNLIFWYLLLDTNPSNITERIDNFVGDTQGEKIFNRIKNRKSEFRKDKSTKFIQYITIQYIRHKHKPWYLQPQFHNFSNFLGAIKQYDVEVLNQLSQIEGGSELFQFSPWRLPLRVEKSSPIPRIQEKADSRSTQDKNLPINPSTIEDVSKPIYSPIIETNWNIWQSIILNNSSQKTAIKQLAQKIREDYFLHQINKISTTATWLQTLIQLSYFNQDSTDFEFLLNRQIIEAWFLLSPSNDKLLNSSRESITKLIRQLPSEVDDNTFSIDPQFKYGIDFFKRLSMEINPEGMSFHEALNQTGQAFYHSIFDTIGVAIESYASSPIGKLLRSQDLKEIYHSSIISILLSPLETTSDWIKSPYGNQENLNQLSELIVELKKVQHEKYSKEIERLIQEIEIFYAMFEKPLDEIAVKQTKTPLFWKIGNLLIFKTLIEIGEGIIAKHNQEESIENRVPLTISSVNEFVDFSLLTQTIEQKANESIQQIEYFYRATNNIYSSLILNTIFDLFEFKLPESRKISNELIDSFNENSQFLPESEHIENLLIEKITTLNYRAGYIQNEYFKESLIPTILLWISYNQVHSLPTLEKHLNSEGQDHQLTDEKIVNQSTESPSDSERKSLITLPYSPENLVEELFINLPESANPFKQEFLALVKSINPSVIDKINAKIKSIWDNKLRVSHIIEGHIQDPTLFDFFDQLPNNKILEVKQQPKTNTENTAIQRAVNQGTRFATGLCGMIMLAPYYGTLFRRMNLIENNNFKSEFEQLKAYSIIFQLAKLHEEESREYQDLIPRIIVGIVPEASISGLIELTKEEIEELEKFLTAVKAQWKLMNNVTLRGFIESFLLRTGKVWKEGDKWKIEVDTHGADIIIKTVPWGFSFIKYPWNSYIIETKWELES